MATTVYLDTCIISGLAKDDLKPDESNALLQILRAAHRGDFALVTSPVAKDEIDRVPSEHRRTHEVIYNLIASLPLAPGFKRRRTALPFLGGVVRLHPVLAKLITALPQKADARHIYQAWSNRADYFLTTDRRTILARATEIHGICQITAVGPTDLLLLLDSRDG